MESTFKKASTGLNRYKVKRAALTTLHYLVNIVLSLIFISPLLYMFISAFNPSNALPGQISSIGDFFPESFTLDNIKAVFTRMPMLRYMGNTLLYAFGTVLGVLVVNAMAGYAIAKIPFRGRGLVMGFIVMMLIIPFEGITLSLYIVVNNLKLINTPMAVIFPSLMSCFYIFMFRQFFSGLPDAVIEAAEIDGAKPFRIFFRIVIPMAIPVFVTVFILEFFGKWSDFYWPMLTLTDKSLYNVQIAINEFSAEPPYHYGNIMAALTVVTLPIVILFLFLQKYYISGIATQGIKDM